MYTRMGRVTVFMMMALMTGQLQAASESKTGDPVFADKVVPSAPMPVLPDPALENLAAFLSPKDAAKVVPSAPMPVLPDLALENLAAFLSPKDAAALRQTSTAFSSVTQTHMADHVINTITSGDTPDARVMRQLERLAAGERQVLLKTSLRAKFGDRPFKIHNTNVFAADMAAVCGRVDQTDPVVGGILTANPIIAQHVKNYYLLGTPEETERRKAAIVASIQTDYRILGAAITSRLLAEAQGTDYVVPKYVTATMEQLEANRAGAEAYFTAHPGVTLVLMAPDGNTLHLGEYNIPESLRSLSIVGDHVTHIGDFFLAECSGLTTIDLSPLSNVTTIGNDFLADCSGLNTIGLSSLSNITTIGNDFLAGCSRLTTIDLRPLSNITTIGNEFLASCRGLTKIDLRPLNKVNSIGNQFLAFCSGLTKIDLSSLSKVTTIGDFFLIGCSSLDATTRAAVQAFKAAVAAGAAAAAGHPAGVAAGVAAGQ